MKGGIVSMACAAIHSVSGPSPLLSEPAIAALNGSKDWGGGEKGCLHGTRWDHWPTSSLPLENQFSPWPLARSTPAPLPSEQEVLPGVEPNTFCTWWKNSTHQPSQYPSKLQTSPASGGVCVCVCRTWNQDVSKSKKGEGPVTERQW